MKTVKKSTVIFLLTLTVYSCQKDLIPENIVTTDSSGTFDTDSTGNCLPVVVNGIYTKDSSLNATHFIDVSINVSTVGSYLIQTDTTNGIYFRDSAVFTRTGLHIVRLKGYGKPLATGTVTLHANYNALSSCSLQLIVNSTSTAAVFTFAGAPSSCANPTIMGVYMAGKALDASNKILLDVNVTAIGNYAISTTSVNGMIFNASGTFTNTSQQTVTLYGNGVPATEMLTNLSVLGTTGSCSLLIPVNTGSTSGTQFIAAYILDTTLAAPFDTVERFSVIYDAMKRPLLTKSLTIKPNGDSLYYQSQTFTYNGNDTFVSIKNEYTKSFSSSPAAGKSSTTYYNFVNGRCTLDSNIFAPNSYQTVRYSYAGNIVLRTGSTFSPSLPSSALSKSTIYKTIDNGNNVYQIDTLVSNYANSGNPATFLYEKEEINTSYLSNPNPFFQVYKVITTPYYKDNIGFSNASAPSNLMTQQKVHATTWGNGSSSDNQNQIDYSFNFRADGYPLICWSTFNNNGVVTKYKYLFFYR